MREVHEEEEEEACGVTDILLGEKMVTVAGFMALMYFRHLGEHEPSLYNAYVSVYLFTPAQNTFAKEITI